MESAWPGRVRKKLKFVMACNEIVLNVIFKFDIVYHAKHLAREGWVLLRCNGYDGAYRRT